MSTESAGLCRKGHDLAILGRNTPPKGKKTGSCVACNRERVALKMATDPAYREAQRQSVLRYKARNQEAIRARGREYGKSHRAERLAYQKAWRKTESGIASGKAETLKRYWSDPEKHREASAAWKRSPEGRANTARYNASVQGQIANMRKSVTYTAKVKEARLVELGELFLSLGGTALELERMLNA